MKKKLFSLILIAMFVVSGLVGGAVLFSADSFLTISTSESKEESGETVKSQATGNWSNYASNGWHVGNKNGKVVYEIYDEMDLVTLAVRHCNAGIGLSYSNKLYSVCGLSGYNSVDVYLENDLDMSAHYWDCPIGNGNYQFKVNFYGQGHTISGLTFNMSSSTIQSKIKPYEGKYGIGLFGVVGDNVNISDLTLSGGSFYVNTNSTSISVRMGAVVGMTITDARVILSNVINNMSYLEMAYQYATNSAIGGLVGTCYKGTINDCFNFSRIEGRSNTVLGGLVGTSDQYCDMRRCGNFGEVEGYLTSASSSGFGGIIGAINEGTSWSILEDCVNYGYINTYASSTSYQTSCVGGIIGMGINAVYVNRCLNYGKVRGTNYVGGIAGRMGLPKTSIKILWFIIELSAAKENVLIANSMNLGAVSGTSTWGKLCGEMNGSENIKACYVIDSANKIGNWNNGSVSSYNIDYWSGSALHNAEFYRGSYSLHGYDFSGTQNHSVYGWKRITVGLNNGGEWTVTTLLYDYYNGTSSTINFNSSYKYSLVPSSLIGTGTLTTKYKRSGSTSYVFTDDKTSSNYADDRDLMKVEFNKVSGNKTSWETVAFNGGNFYFLKGLANSIRNSLKLEYNNNNFTSPVVSSASSNVSVKNVSLSTTSSSTNRTTKLNFTTGSTSSASFTITFQSVAKPLKINYKLVKVSRTNQGNNLAKSSDPLKDSGIVKFGNSNSVNSLKNSFFSLKSGILNKTCYFKESISTEIYPENGYAVMYVLNKTADDGDTFKVSYSGGNWHADEPRSVASWQSEQAGEHKNNIPIFVSNGIQTSNPIVSDVKAANCSTAKVEYKFSYDVSGKEKALNIYVLPIRYQNIYLTMVEDDVEEIIWGKSVNGDVSIANDNTVIKLQKISTAEIGKGIYAFNSSGKDIDGLKGFPSVVSQDKKVVLKREATSNLILEHDKHGWQDSKFKYGYSYTFYVTSYTSRSNYVLELNGDSLLKSGLQLDREQEISLSMKEILAKCISQDEEGARNYSNLHIIIVRQKLNYTFNFIDKISSYTNPSIYNNGNIGGESTAYVSGSNPQEKIFQVEHERDNQTATVNYNFSPSNGYKFNGTSFTNYESIQNGTSITKTHFQTMLDDYMSAHHWNVGELRKSGDIYILDIYVYYQLQTYALNLSSVIYNTSGGTTLEKASFALSSAQINNGTADVHYYKPSNLSVGNVADARFLGWYLNGTNLLSLNQDYKFLIDPQVLVNNNLASINGDLNNTNESGAGGYQLNLVAKFAKYSVDSGSLANAGATKVVNISTADDLVKLSTKVRNGESFAGYVFRQTNDIDMSGVVLNPIGTNEHPFSGTYDGQNHIISNLKFVNNSYSQNLYNNGLFGYTDGATIKNLTIRDSDYTAFNTAGIFVANAKDTTLEHLNNFNSDLSLGEVEFYNLYREKVVGSHTFDYVIKREVIEDGNKIEIVPQELINAGINSYVATIYTLDENGNGRDNFGGLVGKMSGGKIFASSVNSSIVSDSSTLNNVNGLVGRFTSGTIDQCAVENTANNGNALISVANTPNGITNCYYRYYTTYPSGTSSTKYVGTNQNGNNPTDGKVWFKLANGNWALRVLYWN